MDLYQHRDLGPARKRVSLYVEQFMRLATEGCEGDDDEQAPIIDVAGGVTLDVRDLRVLATEPERRDEHAVAYLDAIPPDQPIVGFQTELQVNGP